MLALRMPRMTTVSQVSEPLPVKVLRLSNILVLFSGEEATITVLQGHR